MGYEVKISEIKDVRDAALKQTRGWQEQLADVGRSCQGMVNALGMQGATAESIKSYIQEVHGTLLAAMMQMMGEYQDRIFVYETGYDPIDGSGKAHLTQDTLETLLPKLQYQLEGFHETAGVLQGILDEIADIFSRSAPPTGTVISSYSDLGAAVQNLNETVGSYEEAHKSDCAGVKELISAIRSLIESQKGNNMITVGTYRAGTLEQNPAFTSLQAAYVKSAGYSAQNEAAIRDARERMQAKIEQELADERARQGVWDAVAAVGTIVIGTVAIVATWGAATPLVVAAVAAGGSTIAYGVSNGIEAAYDISYGMAGDITSVASNPIRDTVFLGNQAAYDTWGSISTGISLGFCCAGAGGVSAGKVTVQGVKQSVKTFLGSGAKNIAAKTLTLAGKTAATAGSGVVVEKVVSPYTSEDFGRLGGMLASAYVGSKLFGSKTEKVKRVEGVGGAKTSGSAFGEMNPTDTARYNQYWDDVAKGLDTNTRVKLSQWEYRPNAELYNKYKSVYDNPKYFNQSTGNVKYPGTNGDINIDGFVNGQRTPKTLEPGTIIDRYGSNGSGKYFSPEGTSYEQRALPPFMEEQPYTKYKVVRPLEVDSGKVAPWFEQPGKGIQFLSKYSVEELKKLGYIVEIK